jgi:two-component system, chemotaxis family, chemotaxis protein CheY
MKVVVVDDDEVYRFIAERTLGALGDIARLNLFGDAQTALDGLRCMSDTDELPDFLFLDLHMPVMDGWGFLDAYSKLSGAFNTHIYIVSSSVSKLDMNKASNYPQVKGYLVKPVKREKFEEILLK